MALTDAEIIRLKKLLHEQEVHEKFKALKFPEDDNSTINYRFLHEAIHSQKWGVNDKGVPVLESGYAGVVLEGSSRSSKTWGGIDIIIHLSTQVHKNDGCTINIYRETYNEFKTTLYEDFKRRLPDFDLPNKFEDAQEVKSFKIGKSTINLLGDGKHGGGCDYAFFNEAMMIRKEVFDQVEMRCRRFWWMDYNPSFTSHWVFDNVLMRLDVGFLRTTFLQNPFISSGELNKILSYEPWETGSYEIVDNLIMYNGHEVTETNQPPPNIKNVNAGTADVFMWKVYGLGLRGAMKGVIYSNVTWIDEFPTDLSFTYGLDFGFTVDPSALVRYTRWGNNIYCELLWYSPTETAKDMDEALLACNVSDLIPITADSADKYVSERKGVVQMVRELFDMGWEISKVSKTKGVTYWINDTKHYKIHIVKPKNPLTYRAVKKEQENYKWKEVNGIAINQPIDKHDHFWNAMRYAHMGWEIDNLQVSVE